MPFSIRFEAIKHCRRFLEGTTLLFVPIVKPYDGIGDVYLLDPDGYINRKWNSISARTGVIEVDFDFPTWPKVGFWTIRVSVQGKVRRLKKNLSVGKFESHAQVKCKNCG